VENAMLPEDYPGAFDADGRPERLVPFAASFLVFAQRAPALGLSTEELDAAASRFVGARLGARLPRPEHAPPPRPFDGATMLVKHDELQASRAVLFRAATPKDRALVEASLAAGRAGGGLDRLALRCTAVLLVAAHGDDDAAALTIAEAAARAWLGPVLTPSGALVGPKSLAAARMALAR